MSEIPQSTKPGSPSRELVDAYAKGLLDYLVLRHEPALRRAWELGRNAMASGLSLSDMSAIHHESVVKILARTLNTSADPGPLHDSYLLPRSLTSAESTYTMAASFFAESISPFEMNQREYQQANTALRYRNGRLEEQIRQFSTLVFDEALQLLATAGLVLGRVRQKPTPTSGGNLDEIQSLLDRIGDQLAACASEMQPRVLEDLGLGAAIQSISRRLSAAAQIDIAADTAVGPLLPMVSTTLYRAVEESLTNVLRHAWATKVRIRLSDEAGVVQCSIGDDGIGFDASEVLSGKPERGSGLVFIRESLRVLDGTLVVNSSPGSGTEVVMTIRQQSRPMDETCVGG